MKSWKIGCLIVVITILLGSSYFAAELSGSSNTQPKVISEGEQPLRNALFLFFTQFSFSKLAVGVALFVLSIAYYKWFWRPLNMYKTLKDYEDSSEGGSTSSLPPLGLIGTKSKKLQQKRSAQALIDRDAGPVPSKYPNGWFRVMDSVDLLPGDVKHITFFDKHLVIFRGRDNGKASVLNAYCPHLGANLAHGGTVVGDQIRCPFHGWQFDGKGTCKHIPYTQKSIPDVAATKCWPSLEYNGSIKVWFFHTDDEKAESVPPTWYPPIIEERMQGGQRVFHGKSIHHVRAHCQEIPENGADVAHLSVLHVPFIVEWLGSVLNLRHEWSATWDKGKKDAPHLAHITLTQGITFFGKIIPGTHIPVTITQVGPGIVHLHFETLFGRLYVVESVTPISRMLQQCSHMIWSDPQVPRFVAKFVLRGLVVQFERDIPIWNNKTYIPRPVLVHGDGKINQFRRWYQQFYTSSSSSSSSSPSSSSGPVKVDW